MPENEVDEERLGDFMGQMVGHLVGATTIACSILGHQLGLYKAMAGNGAMSADALASAAGTHPRLTREWLDQQASSGIVSYESEGDTYALSPEAALALAEKHSPVWLAGGLPFIRSMFIDVDKVETAFRGDGAMGWGEHHECLFNGTSEFFRPAYEHNLVQQWLPALSGGIDRITAGVSVADVGCGAGISTSEMAAAFPASNFVGFDYHGPSVAAATARSADHGHSNTEFKESGSKDFTGSFDLICFFDSLHDMGDPVGIAQHAKTQLNEGGSVMIVEPFAFDTRAENHAALGGLLYGASAFLCTPCSLSQDVGRGMGAQSGEAGMRAVFEEAGYTSFRRAADTPFNIVYEAHA
jgi:2-polyprenyl-3-methyl-5-hydroxy-6-metoxy-1,4-benzoquinol methylase